MQIKYNEPVVLSIESNPDDETFIFKDSIQRTNKFTKNELSTAFFFSFELVPFPVLTLIQRYSIWCISIPITEVNIGVKFRECFDYTTWLKLIKFGLNSKYETEVFKKVYDGCSEDEQLLIQMQILDDRFLGVKT